MTYKTAIAGIPYGGGKAVVIADPMRDKTAALLRAMGEFVESLKGRYITSFDAGTTLHDLSHIRKATSFVSGNLAGAGNASASTATGVYYCIRAAVEMCHGRDSLRGVRIAIQGIGNVGRRLARKLAADGARLVIADINEGATRSLADELSAEVTASETIHAADVDVFSPCALGAVLSERSIRDLRARIVVGGANNQLATPADDDRLMKAGVLYCPDYLANAGGIINLHYQRTIRSAKMLDDHIGRLASTFREIVAQSRASGRSTAAISDSIAERRFKAAKRVT
jgi:leucine dehydrogenase